MQGLRVKFKPYPGVYSGQTLFPSAIWHNPKTTTMTLRLDGAKIVRDIPIDAIDCIDLIEGDLPFADSGI